MFYAKEMFLVATLDTPQSEVTRPTFSKLFVKKYVTQNNVKSTERQGSPVIMTNPLSVSLQSMKPLCFNDTLSILTIARIHTVQICRPASALQPQPLLSDPLK